MHDKECLEELFQRYISAELGFQVIEKIGEGASGKVFHCKREQFGIFHEAAVKAFFIPVHKTGEYQEDKSRRMASGNQRKNGYHDANGHQETNGQQEADRHLELKGVQKAKGYQEGTIRRAIAEIQLMIRLGASKHTVTIEDYRVCELPEKGWIFLLRMEYLRPFLLSQWIEKTRKEKLRLFYQGMEALEYLETHEILHGDIKPDNLFIGKDGNLKIGDFGISGLLEESLSDRNGRIGTLAYCPPEFWKSGIKDKTMDRYSFGLIIFQLFHEGYLPFQDQWVEELALKKRLTEKILPETKTGGRALNQILQRMLAFSARKRYPSSKEILGELGKLDQEEKDSEKSKFMPEKGYGAPKNKGLLTPNKKTERTQMGNLWNGGFGCVYRGEILLSDYRTGKLITWSEDYGQDCFCEGHIHSLLVFNEELYGINENGVLVIYVRGKGFEEVKEVLEKGVPIRYLWTKGSGLYGRLFSGMEMRLVNIENTSSRFSNSTDENIDFTKREKRDLFQLERSCISPIEAIGRIFHGGTAEAPGLFLFCPESGETIKMKDIQVLRMNSDGISLYVVDKKGAFSVYSLEEIKRIIDFKSSFPFSKNKRSELPVTEQIEGAFVSVVILNNIVFLQTERGELFRYKASRLFRLN